jgi:serine O-acetyltransferase
MRFLAILEEEAIVEKDNAKHMVDMLVQSYRDTTAIINADAKNQLNRSVIVEILDKLRALIFPGYFGKKHIAGDWLPYYTGELLEGITFRLEEQVAVALTHLGNEEKCRLCEAYTRPALEPDAHCDFADLARDITFHFLSQLPRIRSILATDVEATFDGDPAAFSKDEIISSYPGIAAIMTYRLAHELHLLGVPLIPRVMTEYAHSVTGIDIHPGAKIGRYFCIDHGTGIVIGETTVIGDHVKVYQGVTLGGLSTRGGQQLKNAKRHPTLQDRVTVYSGASIFGGATIIGHDTVIGSKTFIVTPVPANTRVSISNPDMEINTQAPEGLDWVI